jgi:NAD(P)-dependent dehydrogenase (short-subunit alcohol dehydrogenase family)
MGNAGQANYAASKAGLAGLTKSVAKELASRGVRCNALAPGFIRTDMTDALTEAQVEKLKFRDPPGSLGEPRTWRGGAVSRRTGGALHYRPGSGSRRRHGHVGPCLTFTTLHITPKEET